MAEEEGSSVSVGGVWGKEGGGRGMVERERRGEVEWGDWFACMPLDEGVGRRRGVDELSVGVLQSATEEERF